MKLSKAVHIETIRINKQAQHKHFEIRLPENADFIEGIELGYRFDGTSYNVELLYQLNWIYWFIYYNNGVELPWLHFNEFTQYRTLSIGRLSLQAMDQSNFCYSASIPLEDINYAKADVSSYQFDYMYPITHKEKSTINSLITDGDTTHIKGIFRDEMGLLLNADIEYDVFIYLWYKRKTN